MSNVDTVRNAYEAFAKGDVPTVLGTLAPNIAWTEPEGLPYAGTYNGPDAVLNGVFMQLGTEWEGFTVNPAQFLDAGDSVVALGEISGRYKATGKSFRAEFAHVWTLRDSKAVKFRQYADTALAQAALH